MLQRLEEFEKAVAEYLGVKHAIAVTSCTTGLHTVLECLNIKGKDVIIPDYTYPATAEAVILAGGNPVLVDVDLESMNMTKLHTLEESFERWHEYFFPCFLGRCSIRIRSLQNCKEIRFDMP